MIGYFSFYIKWLNKLCIIKIACDLSGLVASLGLSRLTVPVNFQGIFNLYDTEVIYICGIFVYAVEQIKPFHSHLRLSQATAKLLNCPNDSAKHSKIVALIDVFSKLNLTNHNHREMITNFI